MSERGGPGLAGVGTRLPGAGGARFRTNSSPSRSGVTSVYALSEQPATGELKIGELDGGAADSLASAGRLSDSRWLVSTLCWQTAYNMGEGYWVINDVPPYEPVLITTSGSWYDEGTITAAHKGRGIGDCWSRDDWTWDGEQFIHTASFSTGMCRLVAAGGAWTLPTRVTEIRRAVDERPR